MKWDKNVSRKFPDMRTDGVANMLSDSLTDSGVEAPLSTNLEHAAALAFYQMIQTYVTYSDAQHKRWAKLTDKQRKAEVPNLVLANSSYGVLHHLITKGGLIVPPKWTLDIQANSKSSFDPDKAAYVDLDVVFLPIVEQAPGSKVGRPRRHFEGSQIITYRLFKSTGSFTTAQFTLSVKGSGLFLLQGNTDYALPSLLRTKQAGEDSATELQLFVGAMKSPFALLQSLAQVCSTLGLAKDPEVNERIGNIVPFLDELTNDRIRVRGFTFTRYMDFRNLELPNIDIRQDFLRSLFLIYEAAKGNRRTFMNNGMKTYKGIMSETRFEDEDLQRDLDNVYQEFYERHKSDPAKVFRKRAKSVSDIYSIRLSRSMLKKGASISNHLTALQFTVPKTPGRAKLGLVPTGAKYLRDHCLKVRFSVFNKFLMDYKLRSLKDLIQYLCPDHNLDTFRLNLDRLFHRVLEGYDYFYWVGRKWSQVVSPEDCDAWLSGVKKDAPENVWKFLRLWASVQASDTPDLHTLTGLVLRHYYPKAQDPDTGQIDAKTLKEAEKLGIKIAKKVLSNYGVNIKYPRAFHITVSDAFFSSTMHNLQSVQGLMTLSPEEKEKLLRRVEKVLSRLSVLHRPQTWNALALTMQKRQIDLVL